MTRAARGAKKGTAPRESSPADSPPAATVYTFREGSYYTDDQSDDSYDDTTGPQKASRRKLQDDDKDTLDSDHLHAQHCRLHNDPLATHCNALTRARKKCSNKAKVFETSSLSYRSRFPDGTQILPVCHVHSNLYYLWERAGRCQAIEECGHTCDRLAKYSLPYHLCTKHEAGTDTLPCGIMNLPTELHLMILRYLLPVNVSSYGRSLSYPCGVVNYKAIMRTNRALYQASSLVLYSEAEFKATIDASRINFLGRNWYFDRANDYNDINRALCQAAARRIRSIHVEVSFGSTKVKGAGVGNRGISVEEYELYQLRDAVRKFVGLFQPATSTSQPSSSTVSLKQLNVKPVPYAQCGWGTSELTAAIFFAIEPFVGLSPIEEPVLVSPVVLTSHNPQFQWAANVNSNLHKDENYRRLRKSWVKSAKGKSATLNGNTSITDEYHKIEELWSLIQKGKQGWILTAFLGMERVLHICRVIDMNVGDDDLGCMQQIRQAIVKRWVNALREQQNTLSAIATCIDDLFKSSLDNPKDDSPDAFNFQTHDLIEGVPADHNWSEIKWNDHPRLTEVGVTFTEDDLRVYIQKGGKDYVLLKTPYIVRQLAVAAVKRN
ncbi:hypothetical protein E8E13_000778 [Curvularia kusanoi]|uniref:Probable treble clef zinc finger fungi domain-containing protein n=1 Tax=Curvularia kusanoi TaxID=90978 RepID=A0A9P4WAF0_CURKU|nr:hypothetical protein E8E13_000778 [Curvularia kusanoi]